MLIDVPKRIRVLIVEDLGVTRQLLADILGSDPAIDVAGMAGDGDEAIELLAKVRADVVTVGVGVPPWCGFEVTRRIMELRKPLPVVIVSANWEADEVATTFRAVQAGAVAVVARPAGPGRGDHAMAAARLVQTVKAMSEVKVVRRWTRSSATDVRRTAPPPVPRPGPCLSKVRLIAIGASTGGPVALQTILSGLSPECDVPILIVQHIAVGFLSGLSDWLAATSGFPVKIAVHGELALPGCAYLAPDGMHMGIRPDGHIVLERGEEDDNLRPSVARLFLSVAASFGAGAAGVLLTGMGRDGARELEVMRQCGALTIAQDHDSCIVYGMPGEAVRIGAAAHVLNPEQIAALLTTVTGVHQGSR